jgi:hypothetical protein
MYERLGGVKRYEERIWDLVGFLGRYGNQPADVALTLPVDRLNALASAIARLLKEEGEAAKKGASGA